MRVLMLSWEYPPLVVGGLGRHVGALARELAAAGHDVRVVSRGPADPDGPVDVRDEQGVRVVRARPDPLAVDFTTESLVAWAQALEHTLTRAALATVRDWRPDVVHAHDWLVAQTAATIAQVTGAPVVATVHATEIGRHQGWLPEPLHRAIHSVECWLVDRATLTITCSATMRDEVVRRLGAPDARVRVVPNGLDPGAWRPSARERVATRRRLAPDAPLLVFAGRLVPEKGLQTVLDVLGPLRRRHPGTRLAVAGTGPYLDDLHARARSRRVARAVEWLGFVDEGELAAVLAAADAVVVPSLYEPFGLVALEAAACGAPLVLAGAGGLLDLTRAGLAAASFAPGDTDDLLTALDTLLVDVGAARRGAAAVARRVRREYGWAAVAAATADVYTAAVSPTASAGP